MELIDVEETTFVPERWAAKAGSERSDFIFFFFFFLKITASPLIAWLFLVVFM